LKYISIDIKNYTIILINLNKKLYNNIEIYNDLQKLSFCDKMWNGRRTLKEVQNWQSILNEITNTIIK